MTIFEIVFKNLWKTDNNFVHWFGFSIQTSRIRGRHILWIFIIVAGFQFKIRFGVKKEKQLKFWAEGTAKLI